MKKQILLLLLTFFCYQSFCQTQENGVLAISATKMNVVYAALQNPITIAVEGLAPEKLYVTADGGTLTGEKGKYVLAVPDAKTQYIKEIQLNVYETIKPGKYKEIETRIFRVKTVPKPVALATNSNSCNLKVFESGTISNIDAKSLEELSVKLRDFYFQGLEYSVIKYRFIYVPKDTTVQKPFVSSVERSKLTPDIKAVLNNPQKGDMIFFTDIWCRFPGSSDIRLPTGIILTIKNK